jgi:hypothetical protein
MSRRSPVLAVTSYRPLSDPAIEKMRRDLQTVARRTGLTLPPLIPFSKDTYFLPAEDDAEEQYGMK